MASDKRGMNFSIGDHYRNHRSSQVNIRLYLVFFRYLPFYSLDARRIWCSQKAIHQENPMPYVTRSLEQNLPRTSDNTRITPPGHIYRYWCFPYLKSPI